jgi:hypothetical protein
MAMGWLAIDLDLRLRGVELRWKDLKLPLHDAQGRLRFRSDGMLQRGSRSWPGPARHGALAGARAALPDRSERARHARRARARRARGSARRDLSACR